MVEMNIFYEASTTSVTDISELTLVLEVRRDIESKGSRPEVNLREQTEIGVRSLLLRYIKKIKFGIRGDREGFYYNANGQQLDDLVIGAARCKHQHLYMGELNNEIFQQIIQGLLEGEVVQNVYNFIPKNIRKILPLNKSYTQN